VPGGEGRLGVDDPGEGLRDAVEVAPTGLDGMPARLVPGHPVGEVVGAQRSPQRGVGAQGHGDLDQRGIEPAPGAVAGDVQRRVQAVLDHVHREHLREAGDARQQRDVGAGQPVGVAPAVPVLVQAADGLRRAVRQREHPGDVRAALAAGRKQLLRERACARQRDHPARLADRPATRLHRAQRVEAGAAPPGVAPALRPR